MDREAEENLSIPRLVATDGRWPAPSDCVVNVSNLLKQGSMYDLGRTWTIYRAPTLLQQDYDKAFTPSLVAIGPYHREKQSLLPMEEHKMLHFMRFLGISPDERGLRQRQLRLLSRARLTGTSTQPAELVYFDYLKAALRPVEHRARNCYSELIKMGGDDFLGMMVVDGCFLIELLKSYYRWCKQGDHEVLLENNPIFSTRWMLQTLRSDLLMLENQIPFFVLQALFKEFSFETPDPTLIDLVINFFKPFLDNETMVNTHPATESEHMLGVFRSAFLLTGNRGPFPEAASKPRHSSGKKTGVLKRSAMELQKAGIKLKEKKGHAKLLDISFRDPVLEIPQLFIDDNTMKMFLNFLAYEQQRVQIQKPYFTYYFRFLDSLINSKEDVELLHENEIINYGSGIDVADFINKVARDTVYEPKDSYLLEEISEIEEFCRGHKCRMWWSELIRAHFSSPWTALALVVGIFVTLLQLVQTWYSIAPYYRQGSG